MTARRIGLLACAGLIAAPLAWAVNTQLGLILPDADCGASLRASPPLSLLLLAGALTAGWLSWRTRAEAAATRRFVAGVSALVSFVLAFGLLLQSAAALLLTGCER